MNINFVCCTYYDSEDLIIVENFDSFQTKTKKLSLGSVGGLQNYVTDSGDKISTCYLLFMDTRLISKPFEMFVVGVVGL